MSALQTDLLAAVLERPDELRAEQERRHFLRFFRAHPPRAEYIFGRHTVRLIDELDRTTKMLESGRSRYLVFSLPFRQGKSDVSSRRWPAWHLVRNPDHEFMLTCYGQNLAASMSYDVRELIRREGRRYGLGLRRDQEAVDSFRLDGRLGRLHAVGIGGTITGKGAHVLLIDDYFKNREEAESQTIRDKVWDSFESDLMTRLAPVHAVVIVANRWHEDDLVGRIKRKNDPSSQTYDPDFPRFEEIVYPIHDAATDTFLFEERFGRTWYLQMRAAMGSYAWNAQGMQDPVPRGGNRFDVSRIVVHNTLDEFPQNIQYVRAWDPASSQKQRDKEDPDQTAGCLAGVSTDPANPMLRHLWIKDIVAGRWEATERNRRISETAERDGDTVQIGVEAVGGYKDAYVAVRDALLGRRYVSKIQVKGDKTVQASCLEPLCEGGAIHVVRAGWNRPLFDEMRSFPNGKHDDIVNSVWLAYRMAEKNTGIGASFDRAMLRI